MKKTLTLFAVLCLTMTAAFAIPSFDDSQRAKADGYDYGFSKGYNSGSYSLNETAAKNAAEERGYTDDISKCLFYDGAALGWDDGYRLSSTSSPSTYKNPFREYIVTKELQTSN